MDRLMASEEEKSSRSQDHEPSNTAVISRKIYWRCFHCGDAFTKAQVRWARQHFGRDEGELPVCQMRMPGEHHLLEALRAAQDELAVHRAEDTDLMRAIYAMRADHSSALRREEERGYEKGLADGRALSSEEEPIGSERSDEGNAPGDTDPSLQASSTKGDDHG